MKNSAQKRVARLGSRLWGQQLLTRRMQFTMDTAVLVAAFALAYLLRFEFAIPERELSNGSAQLAYVVPIQFAVLYLTGVHNFIWRYIGMAELKSFIKAAILSALPLLSVRIALPEDFQSWRVPFSIIVMDSIFAFSGVLLLRIARRALYERYEKRRKAGECVGLKRAVLLIGAGRAGVLAAKEIQGRGHIDLEIKGFVDDDPHKQKSIIQGIKVLGTTEDLPYLAQRLGIDHVIITIARTTRRGDIRRIVETCETIPVKVRIIPGLDEILQGTVEVSHIRDVEIEDLLGREPVQLDKEDMRQFLAGKTVMVTGAGGSIGSELARQVARFKPSKLLLVERAEPALFNIERELRERCPEVPVLPLLADIGDRARVHSIFDLHRPQVVFHAAAHKHVPMMESNPIEAIKNNVLGTRLIGEIAGEFGVEAFVLISTDKAVRPTSVMGASKRVAELVVQDLDRRFATRFVAVRFGNVIGSAGSVIPIFREQIRKGGPVTVTHPDMVRFFMTIPEAAQLVLQAGTMGVGGEIFILDMGDPVRILDLALDTITLSGLRPHEDIDIAFTGMRPGEKLFEELETTGEQIAKTRHPKIFIGKIAHYPEAKVRHALERLAALSKNGEEQELRRFLGELLPESKLEGLADAHEASPLSPPALKKSEPRQPTRLNENQIGSALPATAS